MQVSTSTPVQFTAVEQIQQIIQLSATILALIEQHVEPTEALEELNVLLNIHHVQINEALNLDENH